MTLTTLKVFTSILWVFIAFITWIAGDTGFCSRKTDNVECRVDASLIERPRYVLYDVNPPEGFNLRRDVFMRMAIFALKLSKLGDWHLVLPPWDRLYHWQSMDVGWQAQLPWSLFFDIPSLKRFAPVVEMHEFLNELVNTTLDEVYILQHYNDGWESGRWEEKFEVQPCHEENPYRKLSSGRYDGPFWGYANITARSVQCLSFHGHASNLRDVVRNMTVRTVMFDHAEVVLHDMFGDALYWRARRSMRFASVLVKLAANFRAEHLNSSDQSDGTVRPDDWTHEKAQVHSDVTGGPYLCVHLRRRDFLRGRPKQVPSMSAAARQVRSLLQEHNLTTVFVATDALMEEFLQLKHNLSEYRMLRYEPSKTVRQTYKDGGVAIIEQIICSHARFFTGTHESTFSFRIQEEREIMGFAPETTFNRLCGNKEHKCAQPTKWRIVF